MSGAKRPRQPDAASAHVAPGSTAAHASRPLTTCYPALRNKFRDAIVVFGNTQHDCLWFAVPHFVSDAAYFFGAETPIFWIVQFVLGHRSIVMVGRRPTVRVLSGSDAVYKF